MTVGSPAYVVLAIAASAAAARTQTPAGTAVPPQPATQFSVGAGLDSLTRGMSAQHSTYVLEGSRTRRIETVDPSLLERGALVRFRPADGRAAWCEGRVTGRVGDTALVASSSGYGSDGRGADPFRVGTTGTLQVWDGDRGSRSSHVLVGAGVGLALGAGIGLFANRGGHGSDYDGEAGTAAAYGTVAGAGVGLVAGAVIGALRHAGPRWVSARPSQPVRVAGLTFRPGLRVAVGR